MTDRGTSPVPVVVRSREELEAQGISFLPQGAVAPSALPITEDGTTFSMAQEATWIDTGHFAVGRWDGSLSIFAFNESKTSGPLITAAVSSPSSEGVQMITWLAKGVFATSNDASSMIVWSSPTGDWKELKQAAILKYDSKFGDANSGTALSLGSYLYLIAGHANGFVTIWRGKLDGLAWAFSTAVDVRSSHPVNPWNLFNVRGVAPILWTTDTGYVVTGSEDGDLCVLQIPSGKILSRTVYNPSAQRGINSIATFGQELLVANCSVGPDDFNLWYYSINSADWSITMRDRVNLKVNPAAPQVFNFDVIWALFSGGLCFFSSTEEGALWMGTISNANKISLIGYQTVTTPLGSALAFMVGGYLVLVSFNLYEFTTGSSVSVGSNGDPEQLPQPKPKQSPSG